MHVLVYDRTEASVLRQTWVVGAALYRLRGDFDAVYPVASWAEMFRVLDAYGPRDIIRLQLWGHGSPAKPLINGAAPPFGELVDFLRKRMTSDGLVWFRSCSVAQGREGQQFVSALAAQTQVRIAAHTHVIHALQSGLRIAEPGVPPGWSPSEGEGGERSRLGAPRTVTCLTADVPAGWRG